MNETIDFLTGDDVSATARRKARYGRRSWLIWKDRQGKTVAAVCSPESVKQAMLATGTQGFFLKVQAGAWTGLAIDWSTAAMWLRHAKKNLLMHFQ